MVRLNGLEILKSESSQYLGSISHKIGEIDEDVNCRIREWWMKWKSVLILLCDYRIPTKLKGKFYKFAIRSALPYVTECWDVKKQHTHNMSSWNENVKMGKWKYMER